MTLFQARQLAATCKMRIYTNRYSAITGRKHKYQTTRTNGGPICYFDDLQPLVTYIRQVKQVIGWQEELMEELGDKLDACS